MVFDSWPEMSMPTSSIALTARGLTWVASVPALIASQRSPARCLSRPSAIWLLAELWVHRNRTLARSPPSAAATGYAPPLGSGEQAVRGLAQQLSCRLPVQGVEAPLPAPILAHQPRVLELLHVVGDLRLAHREDLLELADTDALLALVGRDARIREVAAATAVGHHGEHPHPYWVGERAPQRDEMVHSFLGAVSADAVLLHDSELIGTHSISRSEGLRARMNALASGTSDEAVVAVSPQRPEPPQHPEASANF